MTLWLLATTPSTRAPPQPQRKEGTAYATTNSKLSHELMMPRVYWRAAHTPHHGDVSAEIDAQRRPPSQWRFDFGTFRIDVAHPLLSLESRLQHEPPHSTKPTSAASSSSCSSRWHRCASCGDITTPNLGNLERHARAGRRGQGPEAGRAPAVCDLMYEHHNHLMLHLAGEHGLMSVLRLELPPQAVCCERQAVTTDNCCVYVVGTAECQLVCFNIWTASERRRHRGPTL